MKRKLFIKFIYTAAESFGSFVLVVHHISILEHKYDDDDDDETCKMSIKSSKQLIRPNYFQVNFQKNNNQATQENTPKQMNCFYSIIHLVFGFSRLISST